MGEVRLCNMETVCSGNRTRAWQEKNHSVIVKLVDIGYVNKNVGLGRVLDAHLHHWQIQKTTIDGVPQLLQRGTRKQHILRHTIRQETITDPRVEHDAQVVRSGTT